MFARLLKYLHENGPQIWDLTYIPQFTDEGTLTKRREMAFQLMLVRDLGPAQVRGP